MKALQTIVFFFAFLVNTQIIAQPFSSFDVGVSLSSASILDESYSSRWDLSSAKSFHFRTPFYIGIVGANIDVFDYNARNNQISNFSSINFSSYLGFQILSYKNISIVNGVIVGIQKIDAESDDLDFNAEERELYFSFSIEPQLRIKNCILFGNFQYRKVFNFYRQHILTAGAGIRVNFVLSETVKEFID